MGRPKKQVSETINIEKVEEVVEDTKVEINEDAKVEIAEETTVAEEKVVEVVVESKVEDKKDCINDKIDNAILKFKYLW